MGIFDRFTGKVDETPPSTVPAHGKQPSTPGAGTESHETRIPALELKTILRSPGKVTDEMSKLEAEKEMDIRSILPWNTYTVIDRADTVTVYDDRGRLLEAFASIGLRKQTVGWTDIRGNQVDMKYTRVGPSTYKNIIDARELPPHLRTALDLSNTDYQFSPRSWDQIDDTDYLEGPMVSLLNGKYIVIFDEQRKKFLAFQTERDGVRLNPNNWIRLCPCSSLPQDLLPALQQYYDSSATERVEPLNDRYFLRVTDSQLLICVRGKTGSCHAENIREIEKNYIIEQGPPIRITFCSTNRPKDIYELTLDGEPSTWQAYPRHIPDSQNNKNIHNLKLHPGGKFFLCETGPKGVTILRRDTLEEIETTAAANLSHATFDPEGRIRAVDGDGHLVVCETNLAEVERAMEQERLAKLARGLDASAIFGQGSPLATGKALTPERRTSHLRQFVDDQYLPEFRRRIGDVQSLDRLQPLEEALNRLRGELHSGEMRLTAAQAAEATQGVDELIQECRTRLATQAVTDIVGRVRMKLTTGGGISIGQIPELSVQINQARALEASVAPDQRRAIAEVRDVFEEQTRKLFEQQDTAIATQLKGIVDGEEARLQRIESRKALDEWCDFTYHQVNRTFTELARNCPQECQGALRRITEARLTLQQMRDRYELKFKEHYEQVREQAATITEQNVRIIQNDIKGFLERLRARRFSSPEEANQFVQSAQAYEEILASITALGERDPDAARDLSMKLDVALSDLSYDVAQQGTIVEIKGGKNIVMFGETMFPKFEAPITAKRSRQTEIAFFPNARSMESGVSAERIQGDIGIRVRTATGQDREIRTWEGLWNENKYRLGSAESRGRPVPETYVSQEQFRKIQKLYREWRKGGLKKQRDAKRQALKDWYATREKPAAQERFMKTGQPSHVRTEKDTAWQERYRQLLDEYAKFCEENHIFTLERLERLELSPDPEFENGRGQVPERQKHWVIAPEDEKVLEQMAKLFKMQLDLEVDILNLYGHAGTGKDVYLKMFAERTRRPYFAYDCSKWTTEFELSEDIILASKDGATETIKVPSIVVTALQTPGAILYFNEFNAMPHQAQIFLHRLLDENRSLSLKTSSGKVIKAHPSVLIACSMNPNYEGTFTPEKATQSRMVSLEVNYPPLRRENAPEDANPNKPYSASEALKIARNVDSLFESSLNRDMAKNTFVRWWDYVVNHVGTQPTDLSEVQKFDIMVILGLVEFANNLREHFINLYEGDPAKASAALPVTQPITLREMRRCGYFLSHMTPQEKMPGTEEKIAKDLIETFFLSHIYRKEDRAKIKAAMATWTVKTRLIA